MSDFPKQEPFSFSDADAAKRLRDRVSRDIADVLDAGDGEYANDLLPIYRWLNAVTAEETNTHDQEAANALRKGDL